MASLHAPAKIATLTSTFGRKQTPPGPGPTDSYFSAVFARNRHSRPRASNSAASTPATTPASSSSSSSAEFDDLDCNDDDLVQSEDGFSTVQTDLEFGHCGNELYRHVSRADIRSNYDVVEQAPPYYIVICTCLSFLIMICVGLCRDFLGKRLHAKSYNHLKVHKGYAPLNSDFSSFFTRRVKNKVDDIFNRPVSGVPGRTITLLDRVSDDHNKSFRLTGTTTRALNFGSYNYLGFAQARGGCADAVEEGIRRYGVSSGGSRLEGGSLDLHRQCEALVARFVGQEDALISSMGFATNSTIIPALVSKGCLVISDEFNHASIRFGARLSGASLRKFKHNDMVSLEKLLKDVVSQGQPRTHRPWKKILLIVEGLYSMEGTLVNLPRIMELKTRYKFYLFVDEAHSIGAMGSHGRGVADYFGVNPRQIDILMGTLSKSFGAAGGYISGKKELIDSLRVRAHAGPYTEAVSPPVLTQIMASMASIMGVAAPILLTAETPSIANSVSVHPCAAPAELIPAWLTGNLPPASLDGSEGIIRLRRLAFNARYLSRGLKKLGFITHGHDDSPIVPLLMYMPGKITVFSRMLLERATPIAVVVVGYPATPLLASRGRFCLSAAHTKEDVDKLLCACDEIGSLLDIRHGEGERWSLEDIMTRSVELVEATD